MERREYIPLTFTKEELEGIKKVEERIREESKYDIEKMAKELDMINRGKISADDLYNFVSDI